jgi:hypothetical protein
LNVLIFHAGFMMRCSFQYHSQITPCLFNALVS